MNEKKKALLTALISLIVYAFGYLAVFLIHTASDSAYVILSFYILIPLIITVYTFLYSVKLAKYFNDSPAQKRLKLLGIFELPLVPLAAISVIIDLIRGSDIVLSDYTFLIAIILFILVAVLCGCNLSGRLTRKDKYTIHKDPD